MRPPATPIALGCLLCSLFLLPTASFAPPAPNPDYSWLAFWPADDSQPPYDAYEPHGIAAASADRIYVTTDGEYAGIPPAYVYDRLGTIVGVLQPPQGIEIRNAPDLTVSEDGLVVIADELGDRLVVFDQLGNYVDSWTGSGVIGPELWWVENPVVVDVDDNARRVYSIQGLTGDRVFVFDLDGTPIESIQLYGDARMPNPTGLGVDPYGRLFVGGIDSRIVRLASDGSLEQEWIGTIDGRDLRGSLEIDVDHYGNVLVADENGLFKMTPDGVIQSEWTSRINDLTGVTAAGLGDVYVCQRDRDHKGVDRLGHLPHQLLVEDIAPDQGGQVRLTFTGVWQDQPSALGVVDGYAVYRRQDALKEGTDEGAASRVPKMIGWDALTVIPARGDIQYQYVAPTLCDSTATGGTCWSVFMVSALLSDGTFFDSLPDSGYSTDDIAPGVPQSITADYGATGVALSWEYSSEPDFQFYRVYRGTVADFHPSTGEVVQELALPYWTDPLTDPWAFHYKVSALDDAGNESPLGLPEIITDSPELPSTRRNALHPAVPNPFNPKTTIRFEIASSEFATVRVLDTRGRLVRTLAARDFEPGLHELVFDGRDDRGGTVASGSYLCVLEAGGVRDSQKLTLAK